MSRITLCSVVLKPSYHSTRRLLKLFIGDMFFGLLQMKTFRKTRTIICSICHTIFQCFHCYLISKFLTKLYMGALTHEGKVFDDKTVKLIPCFMLFLRRKKFSDSLPLQKIETNVQSVFNLCCSEVFFFLELRELSRICEIIFVFFFSE